MCLFSRVVLIGLLVAASSLLINGESRVERDTPKKRCGDKVVWGEEAKKGEFPQMVTVNQVGRENREQYCAGVIVNKDYILTAARCAFKEDAKKKSKKMNESEVYVVAGDYDIGTMDADKQKITVSKFIFGPDWNEKTKVGDIALMKLSEPIKLKKKVAQAAILDDATEAPKNGDEGLFAGWGLKAKDPPQPTEKLRVATAGVGTCAKKDEAKNAFCAKRVGLLFTTTICDGDEGGPYFCGRRGMKNPTVCGIANRNVDANCGGAGVFTAVGPYADWIEKTTAAA